MKNLILLFALTLASFTSYSQEPDTIQFPQLITGGGHNFQVIGDHSISYRDSLLSHFGKKLGKKHIWKFKNVEIPGMSTSVTLQVHQGLKGYTDTPRYDANKCGGSSYFYTFTSKKQKVTLLENQNEHEYPALIIYVKQGNKYGVAQEEVQYLEAYLRSIYEG